MLGAVIVLIYLPVEAQYRMRGAARSRQYGRDILLGIHCNGRKPSSYYSASDVIISDADELITTEMTARRVVYDI